MAATDRRRARLLRFARRLHCLARRLPRLVARLLPPAIAAAGAGTAHAVDLPENRAEALVHVYEGGGITAQGPAFLVRKSLADKVSLSGQVYVDAISNASIDVVTTASPYKERRTAVDLGAEFVARDALIKLGFGSSDEPDYKVKSLSLDVSQEVFGGMTTVSLGFGRAADDVGRRNEGIFDRATHWQYRLGVTQVMSPTWLASLNFEAISDSGYLGNPYRIARVFGAAVPERNPRTRTSRAIKLASIHDIGGGQSVRGEYRYFFDTWDIAAHTLEGGYSRRFGPQWLLDAKARWYTQDKALFYADNATAETRYVSRNRQLGTYDTFALGVKGTYLARKLPGQYEIRLHGGYEWVRFDYKDFTDIRTGKPYAFDASILQLYVSATF